MVRTASERRRTPGRARRTRRALMAQLALGALGALTGCDAPAGAPGTGGGVFPEGPCGRGLVVLETDYQSTNVALSDVGGATLSGSFVSSASALPGLVAPLSGDVVVPSQRSAGADVVLIDRYPAAVLTFIDIASAAVRAQLDVSTGFASNPQDYLALADDLALVARYEQNPSPGAEPFDAGSDVLRIDPRLPAVIGRLDLGATVTPGYFPRPAKLVRTPEGRIFALLSAYAPDFGSSLESRLVEITADGSAIANVTVLAGLHGCAALALNDAGTRLAVGCSGDFAGGALPLVSESGLALFDVTGAATELAHIPALALGAQPLGFTLAFARDDLLLTTALGHEASAGAAREPDRLLAVETTGQGTVLRASGPFELGEVRCAPACGTCIVADAEAAVLARYRLGSGLPALDAELTVETAIGLPPRLVGRF